MIIVQSATQLYVQIIPCAVRSAHLWLKSAKVELTSDSFAQPKQHVQCLVFLVFRDRCLETFWRIKTQKIQNEALKLQNKFGKISC